MNVTETKMRVSVWRPHGTSRSLANASDVPPEYFDQDTLLLEEVFSWQVAEDVWSGITSQELRERLQEKLRTTFDPYLSPTTRRFDKLQPVLDELKAVAQSEHSGWCSSQQDADDQGNSLLLNPLSAFCNQLHWLNDVFKNVPNASLTVR
jgi:hypothetical protein